VTRVRNFGIKDLFTTINAMGGAIAICLCIDNRPFAAGIAVILGYVCGDAIDGWVARKLKTQNDFGAEYDTIADHLAHCIAPGAIVYTVYRDADLGLTPTATHWIAVALGSSIMIAASIRHARNVVRPVKFRGIWAGLPRSVLGFTALSYVNSRLFSQGPGGMWPGVVMIPALCIATLTYAPFPNHHIGRKFQWYTRISIGWCFLSTIAVLLFYPDLVFDVFFFFMFGYSTGAWMTLTREERASFREAVKKTLAESRARPAP
jgi:phosphatidylserine synthase